ncbi:serine protease [Beggiatoa sp. PS]|nr:serine protease [Beggiatoa sp. PS]
MPLKNLAFLFLLLILSLAGCSDSSSSSNRNDSPSTNFPDTAPDNNITTGFSLSGTIFVASNTTKDDDVNDENTRNLPNNEPAIAQPISNPVILGGYVNQAGSGPFGNLKISGDGDDYYQVDLHAGERILLFVANENLFGNDLDLGLLNEQGEILDASVGEGSTESLIVPANGRYFIQVQAHLGASNYVLSIGQNFSTTSHGMRLSDGFATNQAIVQFSSENMLQAQTTLNALNMQTESTDTSRRMLFTMNPNQRHSLANSAMTFATPDLRVKYETLMAIKALRQQADIVEASPNYQLQAFRTPNDELYRYQWNYRLMNLPQAWDTTIGDSSVIVAVIDTGVLLDHPDLRGQLVGGYDFIGDPKIEVDGSGGIDANPNDPGDQFPGGSTFHGTHVSGTIAAQTNNNEGVAGVSWLTKIMPLRTLGRGGMGFDYDIEQAMRYSARLPNDSGTVPARRADIINVSLGGPAISPNFQQVINEVRNAGVIVVAASGNENTDQQMFPASLAGVISVGAVNIYGQRSSYSNYGPTLDVMAPGGDSTPDVNGDGMPDGIISTMGNDQPTAQSGLEYAYRSLEGTSMASPHVAGVVSLMKAVNLNLTPQDVDNLLNSGKITDDLGRNGRDDEFGYGLINAKKAVLAAAELSGGISLPAAPLLLVSPQSLNFGLSQTRATIKLSNGGDGELLIENIFENSGGFLTIEGNGLGNYVVTVNRSVLNVGTYTATITITTNTNSVQIPVILQVGDPNATGDAGLHYILLIEPNTSNTVQQTSAFIQNGTYSFQFDNVPIGTYIIAAGTDFNNDGYICDVGEACGLFPTSEQTAPIEVTTNQFNLDFSTGFNVNFISQLSNNGETTKPSRGFALLKSGNKQLPNSE